MRMNPEVEIKELNAIIAQLTERAEKAERERDALAAHVERIRQAREGMSNDPLLDICTAIDDAPETSLAKLKEERAQAIQ